MLRIRTLIDLRCQPPVWCWQSPDLFCSLVKPPGCSQTNSVHCLQASARGLWPILLPGRPHKGPCSTFCLRSLHNFLSTYLDFWLTYFIPRPDPLSSPSLNQIIWTCFWRAIWGLSLEGKNAVMVLSFVDLFLVLFWRLFLVCHVMLLSIPHGLDCLLHPHWFHLCLVNWPALVFLRLLSCFGFFQFIVLKCVPSL